MKKGFYKIIGVAVLGVAAIGLGRHVATKGHDASVSAALGMSGGITTGPSCSSSTQGECRHDEGKAGDGGYVRGVDAEPTSPLTETATGKPTAEAPATVVRVHPVGSDHVQDRHTASLPRQKAIPKSRRFARKPLTLNDIPDSPLRNTLLVLSQDALDRALAKLSEVDGAIQDAQSLRSDADGGIFYVCALGTCQSCNHAHNPRDTCAPADASAAAEGDDGSAPYIAGASVPISNPPVFHSREGASNVLFLDFNGHVISGTAWNNNATYYNISSWDCRPFSIDGDETTFSATEQEVIRKIWERVAEDYAPFDVDVTTEQPASWNRYTGHALITPTTDKNSNKCPHYGYGGIAYVNVFGYADYSYDWSGFPKEKSPAWVTPMNNGDSYADTAEAISHELGHNLGLSHDGRPGGGDYDYYWGHGTGNTSWAPIMGAGYNKHVTQWSQGDYYDSNQTQDDLDIINGKLAYRSDDHGDSSGSATAISITSGIIASTTGVVEQTTDVDVFSLSLTAGDLSIDIDPYVCANGTRGGNLDVSAVLYDSGSALIVSNNPTSETYADIAATIPSSGTYYLHITGVGTGDPLDSSPSGYTAYGSLGQYYISGTISDSVSPPGPASSPSPSDAGTDIALNADLSWTMGNGAVSNKVYFGTTTPLNGDDLKTTQTAATYDPGALAVDTTYYWRIDGVNAGGTTTGTEWSFTTVPAPPSAATSPAPGNSATDLALDTELSWTMGSGAVSNKVYFGTTTPLDGDDLKSTQTGTTYEPGALAVDTTYYWRIDEINAGGTTPGPEWSFTTSEEWVPIPTVFRFH
jgi:hypothetical protein